MGGPTRPGGGRPRGRRGNGVNDLISDGSLGTPDSTAGDIIGGGNLGTLDSTAGESKRSVLGKSQVIVGK